MHRYRPRPIHLALAGALILSACDRGPAGSGSDAVPETERYGGTLVLGGITDLQSMNALASSETRTRQFQRDVLFLPLVRYDAGLEPRPWLAEGWDTARVAPDTLELTFRLRRDVRWHDGTPTTAEDIRFTWERVRDPAVGSPLASGFARYAPGVEVVDPHTVRVRLRPHADFLDGWAQLPILPAHLLGDVPPAELRQHPFGTVQPVGNGPFRFVRRVPNQEWVFEANPEFPAGLGGRPYLDRLVYRVVPDQTTLLTELLTGGVDVYLALNPAQVAQVRGSPRVDLVSGPSNVWTFIAWNSALPLFESPRVRRALTLALDRQQMVDVLLDRHGEVGRSVVSPGHWSFDAGDPELAPAFDREEARRLLAEAGWLDRDGDGVLEDPAGRPFRFRLAAPQGNQARTDLATIAQAQLRELGIDAQPVVLEGGTLIRQLEGRPGDRGRRVREYEAVVMGLVDSPRKDDSNLFHSRNLDGPFQIAGFSHPRVDALLDTLGLIVDREQARPLWREYQRLMAEESPFTVVYYPHGVHGVSRRVRGVEADARGELVSVARWWVDPAGRRPAAGAP
jgi:peptide/nickel transport system substrate-binding protein